MSGNDTHADTIREPAYRVGRKLGRTVYRNDELIGMMDTPELGALVVEALSSLADAPEQLEQALTALDLMGKHTEAGDEQNCPCCTATATARKHARALVADLDRERARADQAEAALAVASDALKQTEWWGNGWESEIAMAALRGVSNAYGCFAGCTGALPGAPADGSGHTPACRAARAALAGSADGTTEGEAERAEVERERARAERAEAALRQIVPDVRLLLDDHFSGCVEERGPGMRAAGRLITLLEADDEETQLPVGGIDIPGPTTAERHAANRAALSAGSERTSEEIIAEDKTGIFARLSAGSGGREPTT